MKASKGRFYAGETPYRIRYRKRSAVESLAKDGEPANGEAITRLRNKHKCFTCPKNTRNIDE
jgi:hypothetical protein